MVVVAQSCIPIPPQCFTALVAMSYRSRWWISTHAALLFLCGGLGALDFGGFGALDFGGLGAFGGDGGLGAC